MLFKREPGRNLSKPGSSILIIIFQTLTNDPIECPHLKTSLKYAFFLGRFGAETPASAPKKNCKTPINFGYPQKNLANEWLGSSFICQSLTRLYYDQFKLDLDFNYLQTLEPIVEAL